MPLRPSCPGPQATRSESIQSQRPPNAGGERRQCCRIRVMLRTKSVWSPIDRKRDGLRILATRFRGRGMGTTRYDVWMASLGPSERLLKAFHAGKLSWAKFSREYRAELKMDGPIDKRSRTI